MHLHVFFERLDLLLSELEMHSNFQDTTKNISKVYRTYFKIFSNF